MPSGSWALRPPRGFCRLRGKCRSPLIVGHEHDQAMVWCVLLVPGYQLGVVVVQKEVEGVLRFCVNDHHVGIVHGQLAETEYSTPVEHVVRSLRIRNRQNLHLGAVDWLERQRDCSIGHLHCPNSAFDQRWWKEIRW